MADAQQAHSDWLRKVLGIEIPAASAGKPVPGSAFAARRDALEPRLLEAMRADPEQRGALSAAWEMAQEIAEQGDAARAQATLDRLAQSIDRVLAAPEQGRAERLGIQPGLVAQRRAELQALLQAQVETSRTIVAQDIAGLGPGLDEVIERPQAMAAAVERHIAGVFDRVHAELDAATQAGDVAAIQQRVAALQNEIAADAGLAAIGVAAAAFDFDDPRESLAAMFDEFLAELAQPAA